MAITIKCVDTEGNRFDRSFRNRGEVRSMLNDPLNWVDEEEQQGGYKLFIMWDGNSRVPVRAAALDGQVWCADTGVIRDQVDANDFC